jgi:tetratricopeptide (TPR) repeat protein
LAAQPLSSQQRALDEAEAIFQRAVTVQERGLRHQADRLFLDAEHKFRVVLRASPRHAHALGRLSAILQRQRRFAEARDLLAPAIREGLADIEVRWQLALAEEGLGHHEEAAALAMAVAQLRADGATYAFLGRVHYRRGDLEAASAAWDRYADQRPAKEACLGADREISELRAEIEFHRDQHRLAIPILLPCHAAYPDDARLVRNLATALAKSGEPRRALELLMQLHGAEADSPRTIEAKAYALIADRQAARALSLLGRLGHGSQTPPAEERGAWARRELLAASAHGMLDRDTEAHAAYTRALLWDPGNTDAQIGLGILLSSHKRFEEALGPLRQARTLRPRSAEACHHLGRSLAKLGRHDESIDTYRSCLGLEPGSAEAQTRLATALLAATPTSATPTSATIVDEALALCEKALAIQPTSTAARRGVITARRLRARRDLADAQADTLALSRAAAELQAAHALDATDTGVVADLAVVLFKQGLYAEAQALLTPMVGAAPVDPTVLALYLRASTLTGTAQAAASRVATLLGHTRPTHSKLALELAKLHVELGRLDMAAHALATVSAADPSLAELEGKLHLAAAAGLLPKVADPQVLEAAEKHAERARALLQGGDTERYACELAVALLSLARAPNDAFSARVQRLAAHKEQLFAHLSPAGLALLFALRDYLGGDFAMAVATAGKALAERSDTDTPEATELRLVLGLAHLGRARHLLATDNTRGAEREAVLAARTLADGDPYLVSVRAVLAYRQGQRAVAQRLWQSLEAREIPEALLGLCVLAFEASDVSTAIAYGERYVRLGGAKSDEVRSWLDSARRFVGKGGPLP